MHSISSSPCSCLLWQSDLLCCMCTADGEQAALYLPLSFSFFAPLWECPRFEKNGPRRTELFLSSRHSSGSSSCVQFSPTHRPTSRDTLFCTY